MDMETVNQARGEPNWKIYSLTPEIFQAPIIYV